MITGTLKRNFQFTYSLKVGGKHCIEGTNVSQLKIVKCVGNVNTVVAEFSNNHWKKLPIGNYKQIYNAVIWGYKNPQESSPE